MELEDANTLRTYLAAKNQLDRARFQVQTLRVNRQRLVQPDTATGR
ncbi:hypothetical protein ACWGOK_36510 [Streptomyces eurythermus]